MLNKLKAMATLKVVTAFLLQIYDLSLNADTRLTTSSRLESDRPAVSIQRLFSNPNR